MFRKKGIIIKDLLLSIAMLSFFLPIAVESFKVIHKVNVDEQLIQDEIVSIQLRRLLALSSDLTVSNELVQFHYSDKDWKLYHVNDHVILTPGVQIQYIDCQDAYFTVENKVLHIHILRQGHYYSYALSRI
ncbi:MAG: hypothetical protein Q4A47_01940 [Erysipelotrichaceae bacterium]|nr:hypothetical protein [Erysipelotrichaceae bacterium]